MPLYRRNRILRKIFLETDRVLRNSADDLLQKSDAWKHPALKYATVVPVRITDGKRRQLNKEYAWNRY